jgi:hypothetical protein
MDAVHDDTVTVAIIHSELVTEAVTLRSSVKNL